LNNYALIKRFSIKSWKIIRLLQAQPQNRFDFLVKVLAFGFFSIFQHSSFYCKILSKNS